VRRRNKVNDRFCGTYTARCSADTLIPQGGCVGFGIARGCH
jgi:hypothetical protein